jgi:hypothetical protein
VGVIGHAFFGPPGGYGLVVVRRSLGGRALVYLVLDAFGGGSEDESHASGIKRKQGSDSDVIVNRDSSYHRSRDTGKPTKKRQGPT